MADHYDVLIIGAGISGVGMACHLRRHCPEKTFALIERRQAIGGTWDLFRYPGIRSDSDMLSFGYRFRPWTDARILADGPSIRRYVHETAQAHGVDQHVRFGLRTLSADWCSRQARWTVTTRDEATQEIRVFSCRYLVTATGYYDHDRGYLPDFPGREQFQGQCVHPQHWPEHLDYKGKRVVVIGSGATAVTLLPAMAGDTAHITMLQRSPSYVYSLPGKDRFATLLKRLLPDNLAYGIARQRNIRLQRLLYKTCRRFPDASRALLLGAVRRQLGADADMRHFTPRYQPWDERLCAVPEGDLFRVIREGKASVVTDQIETFTTTGIRLKSGRELAADIIITATGLTLQTLGGMTLSVDGRPCQMGERMTYKGVLLQDVPNLAYLFGYTNISWTLKIDLAAEYVCRVLQALDERDAASVTPRAPAGEMLAESVLGSLQAGYIQRGESVLPRQGRSLPWRVLHHYEQDSAMLKRPLEDAALEWRPR